MAVDGRRRDRPRAAPRRPRPPPSVAPRPCRFVVLHARDAVCIKIDSVGKKSLPNSFFQRVVCVVPLNHFCHQVLSALEALGQLPSVEEDEVRGRQVNRLVSTICTSVAQAPHRLRPRWGGRDERGTEGDLHL